MVLSDTEFFRTTRTFFPQDSKFLACNSLYIHLPPCLATCLTPVCTQGVGLELKRYRLKSCIVLLRGAEILRWSLSPCVSAVPLIRTYPLWLCRSHGRGCPRCSWTSLCSLCLEWEGDQGLGGVSTYGISVSIR